MAEESKIRDVVDAVTGVVTAVPIYQDVVQPAAQEVGKGLLTIAKTIHIVLAPVSALVWGYDQVKEFVSTKVAERLKNVPPENLITPKPNVAGPALEALRYIGHESSLSDLYANLIASAMDSTTAEGAHPAFVEIIKQLTPDEAKLVRLFVKTIPLPVINVRWNFKENSEGKSGGADILVHYSHIGILAGCEYPNMTPTYLGNLCRLGLAEIADWAYTMNGVYDALENDTTVKAYKTALEATGLWNAVIDRKGVRVTELGKQFVRICVVQKQ